MKENNEDLYSLFNLDEIPERELFVHHVSYKDETYTFYIDCCLLTVNGEENVCSVDIVLHPKEVMEIRDYFFLRGKHWEEYVTPKFKEHSPELYEKINAAIQELWRQSDEYQEELQWLEASEIDTNRDFVPIWPNKLFEEMNIKVPNATIWAVPKNVENHPGSPYPIYLEPEYIAQLKEILEKRIWDDEQHLSDMIDIQELSDGHMDLCKTIEARTQETLVYAYYHDESNQPSMDHFLWTHSLPRDPSFALTYAHYDPIDRTHNGAMRAEDVLDMLKVKYNIE